jgi:DNA gyrase/topoisomerase IV subunit B
MRIVFRTIRACARLAVHGPLERSVREQFVDFDKVVSHLREQAYLVKGMRITIIDAREAGISFTEIGKELYIRDYLSNSPSQTFYFEGGLRSLISFQNRYQKPIHKNIF